MSGTASKAPESVIVYLACPYSHPEAKVREERWLAATRAAASLMSVEGWSVISPVSMGHPISIIGEDCDLPGDFERWQHVCMAMLYASDILVILCLDGWKESLGVAAEIAEARNLGFEVKHLWPVGDDFVFKEIEYGYE